MPAYVYILASRRNGTLYTGSTTDVAARLAQHRTGEGSRFTGRYDVVRLVHLETFDELQQAQAREFAIKNWRRAWKIRLIEETNPTWRDLSLDLNR